MSWKSLRGSASEGRVENVGVSQVAEQKKMRGREEGESFDNTVWRNSARLDDAFLREYTPILSCQYSAVSARTKPERGAKPERGMKTSKYKIV